MLERRGRIADYVDEFPGATYCPTDPGADHNPMWNVPADCAFPSATQNEINEKDAKHLIRNGVYVDSLSMARLIEGPRVVIADSPKRRSRD